MPQDANDLLPGYYKTRLHARGPHVPIKVWQERGEFCRIREGKLFSHMVLRCRWWPKLDSDLYEEIDPFEERNYFTRCMFFEDIDEDEFDLMMTIKEL